MRLPVRAALLIAALLPSRADAHLSSTGLGPVYDGLAHFLSSPEDLIPVLALALFAGLRGPAHGRRVLFVLPAAWLLGGFIGLAGTSPGTAPLACISFLLLGGLLAADAGCSARWITGLAALVGLSHGYLNGSGLGSPADASLVLLGIAAGIFLFVALLSSFVLRLRRPWTRVAVRVAGSWIVASGILLLGWAVRRS
jgi:hydrogenase/urease accessory protein HupE